jgi:hypothetical protein
MSLGKIGVALVMLAATAGVALHVPAGEGETALVVHVGNDPADLRQFEQWLGCPVDGVAVHTGQADWADWSGSVGFQLNRWRGTQRRLYWTIPLIPMGASLAEAGRGRYAPRYVRAAREILAGTPGDAAIPIRTGWEFNADFFPWASRGRERDYIAAFRGFVAAFRSVSPRFRFEWVPNIGGEDDPARSYPGDDVVDVIGMDAYYDTRWLPDDARLAWVYNVERPYGFRWLETFAAAHDKPTAYAEWGVMSPRAEGYVEGAAAWFDHTRPVYQSYWDSDSTFQGKLSGGALRPAGAAYRTAFASCRKAEA